MKRLALIVALSLLCLPCLGQSVVTISSTVTNAVPVPAGINMGLPNAVGYAGNGQYLKNLLENGANPGFEPFRQQQIWTINAGASVSTTSITANQGNSQYDGVPANFWVGASIEIDIPGAAPGSDVFCTSTITASTVASGTAPLGATYTFSPACASAPSVGYIFKLLQTISPTPSSAWNGGGGPYQCASGSCTSASVTICPACGVQALNLNATSISTTFNQIFDNLNEDYFVLLNGAYQMSYWCQAVTGTVTVNGQISRSTTGLNQTFSDTCTTTAALKTHSFTLSEAGTGSPTNVLLQFVVPSGNVYLDNLDLEPTGGISANTSRFRDEVYTAMRTLLQAGTSANPGTCRFGNPMGTLADLTAAEFTQPATFVGLYYSGAWQQPTWPMYLGLAKAVGCTPIMTTSIAQTATEAAQTMDYLAGGSGTTYGALRIAQGQAATYSSLFPFIIPQIGNENWNPVFTGTAIGYRSSTGGDDLYNDYFLRSKTILAAARASASYVSLIKFSLGVLPATTASSTTIGFANPDFIETAGYYANTISDTSTTALLWQPTLVQPWVYANSSTDSNGVYQSTTAYNAMNLCGPSHTAVCQTMHYEENVNTYKGSINQATLDGFVQAAGMGVAAFEESLENVTHGVPVQNLFSLSGYYNSLNGLNAHIWGAVVDMGGATNLKRPTFLGTQLANSAMIGPEVTASISSLPTFNQAANNNDVAAVTNVPAISVYSFSDGAGHVRLAIINRNVSTSYPITFAGALAPTNGSTVTLTQLNYSTLGSTNEAANLNPTNTTGASVTLATSSLTGFNPATPYTLPAASVQVLSYTLGSTSTAGWVILQ